MLKGLLRVLFNGKNLLYTNLGISVSLSGLGDVLTQELESGKSNQNRWNVKRTCRMSISFGLTSGFLCHYWYIFLDKRVPGKSLSIVARKILYDQILFSPINIVACLAVAGLLEACSRKELIEDIADKGLRLYLAEWFIWPPAQFFNFYFLPTRFRVIYDNTISLGYDMYTSHVKYSSNSSTSTITTYSSAVSTLSAGISSIQNSKSIWSLNLNFDLGDD